MPRVLWPPTYVPTTPLKIMVSNEMSDWKSISLIGLGSFNRFNENVLAFSSIPIKLNHFSLAYMSINCLRLFSGYAELVCYFQCIIWININGQSGESKLRSTTYLVFLLLQAELIVQDILKGRAYHIRLWHIKRSSLKLWRRLWLLSYVLRFALFLHPITMCTSLQWHWECV